MPPQFVEPQTTLIDELLAQQKSLRPGPPGSSLASSAVTRFAQLHDQHALPAQARYYRDLIPLNKPAPGEQYAFEVDLDKCSGCKACVTACHSLNGLDESEVWRTVGILHTTDATEIGRTVRAANSLPAASGPSGKIDAFQRHVTTACHHCIDPACLNGCPVLAYEKDPITGIVKHLDDQCIGCSYCILKCPYDVPKYSAKRGIVRKCDMCSTRLASGEAPACVQACPNEAIRITLVDREEISRAFSSGVGQAPRLSRWAPRPAEIETTNTFLPDSPAPDYTRPTTKYRSAEPLHSNLRGADHAEIKPAQAHPSLVLFLVLTQMSVGGFTLATLLGLLNRANTTLSLLAGLLGIAISVSHLGRPQKAWRAFLGLKTSWLSREIIAFAVYAPCAIALTLSFWLPVPALLRLQQPMAVSVLLTGMTGVFTSIMVYHDTRRKFWRWPAATEKFLGTTILLAASLLNIPTLLTITAALKLFFELSFSARFWSARASRRFGFSQSHELQRTAHLLTHDLRTPYTLQLTTLALAAALSFTHPLLTFSLVFLSELLERHLFFTAVSPDRMPGVPR